MLGEFFSELRAHANDRIRSPILGPFSVAWFIANWKPLTILYASNEPIETRILFIEEHYTDVIHLLVVPLLIAIFYALALPWINLKVQHLQEGINLKRRKHKLGIDTDYLLASLDRAEAQASVNRVLAKDDITRKQQAEIDQLKKDLNESQETANANIAAKEAELEQRRKEFEERSDTDSATAEKERHEIEKLREQLKEERERAEVERRKVSAELHEKQKELEARLDGQRGTFLSSSNAEFEDFLLSRKFTLFHNPSIGPERSKPVKFEVGGKIIEGNNSNENTWKIANGKLELIQTDGKVHSRFFFLPDSKIFVHTGDKDTKSAKGQYIIPESKSEPTKQGNPGSA